MPQHLSIRVPWHDAGWKGTVCASPDKNTSCLRLTNIFENRDEEFEKGLCGQCMRNHEENLPCIAEGGSFMSPFVLKKMQVHPYKEYYPDLYGHFRETMVTYPAYSFPGRPYSWLLRRNIENRYSYYGIKYDSELEPDSLETVWVQEGKNHRAIFDYFYGNVIPDQSLCVAYAKQVPFSEELGRIVIGMGYVTEIVPAVEHNRTEEGKITSLTWETHICHSIREDHKNGFIIPYEQMLEFAEDNPDFDINSIIVKAPNYLMSEFSYATEHVSYDAMIDVVNSCISSFKIINDCLDDDYSDVIDWLKDRLKELWAQRGSFPGFDAMLCSLGVQWGMKIGEEFRKSLKNENTFWTDVDNMMRTPEKYLSRECADKINSTVKMTWEKMSSERKTLFKILSRYSLSIYQANILFNPDLRYKEKILFADNELIDNPYILFERTRLKARDVTNSLYISVESVDKAIFPIKELQNQNPLSEPSRLEADNDKRRVRALAVSVMEEMTQYGHTIYPELSLISRIKELTPDPECHVSFDILNSMRSFLNKEMIVKSLNDKTNYYKLNRINEFDEVIERRVRKRIKPDNKLKVIQDWNALLAEEFGAIRDESDKRARKEKAAALKVLAESRISVLIGGAGTGKTRTLSILCRQRDIARGGVLLLAPTGKATVRLKESISSDSKYIRSMNVAQLLVSCKRFDGVDKRYLLDGRSLEGIEDTVIIDEASMLTTEMMGALLNTVRSAKRIIFVGDPHQLPPIGAGRPFVDLVKILEKNVSDSAFPKIANCYAKLTVNQRQRGNSDDLLDAKLSELFTGEKNKGDDCIIDRIVSAPNSRIRFEFWESREELEELILKTASEILGMKDVDDTSGFNEAMGGKQSGSDYYFNRGCADKVDNWQILAPVRNQAHGVTNINHLFHSKYRQEYLELIGKKIPFPFGPEGIVYGDKVINVVNKRKEANPNGENSNNYVANGEIGIVCDCFGGPYYKKSALSVEFSSQKGRLYSFTPKDDLQSESNTASLELAYALTVHKAQGSQFKKVILVLSEPCGLLSRELIYTALTRQENEIVILYNGQPYQLYNYISSEYSEISRRFTDLFSTLPGYEYVPGITKVNDKYYDDRHIHKTIDGKMVRSKSEVIICNILASMNVDYSYEKELYFDDEGITVHPDFTVYDPDEGKTWYWEHCGMLEKPDYASDWERKKKLYERHGITEETNLIITRDVAGAIDAQSIKELIEDYFL